MRKHHICGAILITLMALAGAFAGTAAGSSVSVTHSLDFSLGGLGPRAIAASWSTNRIYTANWDSGDVTVIDGETNSVLTTVGTIYNPSGIAVNESTNLIYVASHYSDAVSVIDGATNAITATIPVGDEPKDVAVSVSSNRIYVANSHSSSMSVIDGATNTVIQTVPVGYQPSHVAVNPATNLVYVAETESGTVSTIDGNTNTVVATVAIPEPGDGSHASPGIVEVDPITNRVYVAGASHDSVYVIDGSTNELGGTLTVGHTPSSIVVDTTDNRILVAGGNGDVTVLDGLNHEVLGSIELEYGGIQLAITPDTHSIYAANTRADYVTVVDSSTFQVTGIIGGAPEGYSDTAVNPATNRVYACGWDDSGNVLVIDGETNKLIAVVPLWADCINLALNPVTNRIYAVAGYGTIEVIDGETNAVVASVPVGYQHSNLVVNPSTDRVYMGNRWGNGLLVIDGETNTVVTTVPLTRSADIVALNPSTGRIYVVEYNTGETTILDELTGATVGNISLGKRVQRIDINPVTNRIYASLNWVDWNGVSVVDGDTNALVTKIAIGEAPRDLGVNTALNRIYVADFNRDTLSVIDGYSNAVTATLPVGSYPPTGVSVNPVTNRVYFGTQPHLLNVLEDSDTDRDGRADDVDNCVAVYNLDQLNSDATRQPNGSQIPDEWASDPAQDGLGDACDPDNDNDGLPDSSENDASCPYRLVSDSDGDTVLDGYEVSQGKDPCNAADKPVCSGSLDADGDGFTDCVEHLGYDTCASVDDSVPGWTTCADPTDSDGDACADWIEIVDINGDRQADVLDVLFVAKRVFGLIPTSDSDIVMDVDKNGSVNLVDALLAAKNSNLVKSHSPCTSEE